MNTVFMGMLHTPRTHKKINFFTKTINNMAISLDYTPKLESKEIFAFIKAPDTYIEEPLLVNGYTFIENRNVGTEDMSLFCSLKETYNIIEKNRVVNTFSMIVPIEQKVKLTIKSNLFISDTVVDNSERQKIIEAFRQYDAAINGDIDDYVHKFLVKEPSLSYDMVSILSSFRIDKVGNAIQHRNQVNSILSLYNDIKIQGTVSAKSGNSIVTGVGTSFKTEVSAGCIINLNNSGTYIGVIDKIISDTELLLKDTSYLDYNNIQIEIVGIESEFNMIKIEKKSILLSQYFRDKEIKAVLTQQELIEQLPVTSSENVHLVESKDEKDIDSIVKYETAGLDCGYLITEKINIVRIPTLPDFRTEIVWKIRKIGCLETKLPWFEKSQVRYVYQTLYACISYRKNIDKYIFNRIVSAAEDSAKSAAVIGIWLGSFDVALSSFKAIFEKNIESLVENEKKCLTPFLAVLQEKGEWEDL